VEVQVITPSADTKTFRIHKNFICYYSPFFDAAFNGKFVEGETQSMKLEDTCAEAFGGFCQLALYKRHRKQQEKLAILRSFNQLVAVCGSGASPSTTK